MPVTPLSVTEVSDYIKTLLDEDRVLSQVCIMGELSNYKVHSSGHHYFTLKDEGAVISAVMFRGDASKLRFRPESGMRVLLYGRISSFPKSGQYQVYASSMQPDGVGALYVAFEQLKEKLLREGLFDGTRKKPLPRYPRRVAVVTSPTGAAVRDMLRILGRRFPLCHVLICPVKVQGVGAAQEIAAMLDYVNRHTLADVIITGRGGGSIEDLWAFNEEIVARAIARSQIPVISAVGHEPDVTISDFVADVRAATPSNAAELAVCDAGELRVRLSNAQALLNQMEHRLLRAKREQLALLASRKVMQSPYEYLNERRMALGMLEQQLAAAMARTLAERRQRYVRLAAYLDAISPLKVLGRGYSLATRDEQLIKSVKQLSIEDEFSLKLSDGAAKCRVTALMPAKRRRTI